MTGKTHQVIGITAALGGFFILQEPTYQPATFVAVLVAAHFGSLLPDIDSSAADIWNSVPAGKHVGRVATKFTFGHRNLTHSLLGLALVGFLTHRLIMSMPHYWGLDLNLVWLSFIIGYVFHLLADAVTVLGVPLLWPLDRSFGFPPKPFEGVRIQSGQWFENLLLFPLVNLVLIALIWSNIGIIKEILFK